MARKSKSDRDENLRPWLTGATMISAMAGVTMFALAETPRKPAAPSSLWICSFNIQFLGVFEGRDSEGKCRQAEGKCRDNEALAQLMKSEGCDIVVVQELDAPPNERLLEASHLTDFPALARSKYNLLDAEQKAQLRADPNRKFLAFPDGTPIKPVDKVDFFFHEMIKAGYDGFVISDEDTGPGLAHSNGSATEWYVTFFKSDRVDVAADLPHGWLGPKRFGPKDWQRTPYAVPFRLKNRKFDFVLISVHWQPGAGSANENRRKEELTATKRWIEANDENEKDFIVLGDMNIEGTEELARVSPFASLNNACVPTNTNPKPGSAKPYDHVMYDQASSTDREIPREITVGGKKVTNFFVINLIQKMENRWYRLHPNEPYPGGSLNPRRLSIYNHDRFRVEYSDHHPVKFRVTSPTRDDDGPRR